MIVDTRIIIEYNIHNYENAKRLSDKIKFFTDYKYEVTLKEVIVS